MMRRRWCRRPDSTRADIGTSNGSLSALVLLSSSLSAGWRRNRATTRASFSTLGNLSNFSDKPPLLALGIGLQICGKDSFSTSAWRLEEGPEIEQLEQFFIDLHETLCVADCCTPN